MNDRPGLDVGRPQQRFVKGAEVAIQAAGAVWEPTHADLDDRDAAPGRDRRRSTPSPLPALRVEEFVVDLARGRHRRFPRKRLARRRARTPRTARSRGVAASLASAAPTDSAVRSTGMPATRSATNSSTPLTGGAMIGSPDAAASSTTRGAASYMVGKTKTSAAEKYSAGLSTDPTNRIRSAAPTEAASAANRPRSPSPTTSKRGSRSSDIAAIARIAGSRPLRAQSPPTNSATKLAGGSPRASRIRLRTRASGLNLWLSTPLGVMRTSASG